MILMQTTCPGCKVTVDVDLQFTPGKPKQGKLVDHSMPSERPWSRPHANTYQSGLSILGPPCVWSGARVIVELDRLDADPPKPVVK